MISVEKIIKGISDAVDLRDTYDASKGSTEAAMATSARDSACEAYKLNPSAETAQAVKDAERSWLEAYRDIISAVSAPGQGGLIEDMFDFVTQINNARDANVILEDY